MFSDYFFYATALWRSSPEAVTYELPCWLTSCWVELSSLLAAALATVLFCHDRSVQPSYRTGLVKTSLLQVSTFGEEQGTEICACHIKVR